MSDRLLNVHGVVASVGLSKSRIYAMVRLGEFPRPRRIEGRSMWRQSDVDMWVSERWESAPAAGTVAGSEWTPKEKAA